MPAIITRTLDCGMPLLLEPITGVTSAALCWLVPAGTAAEPADRLGLSTVISELVMRGAGELDSRQHADALDRLGVARSTSVTGHHMTLDATMLGARLDDALPLLIDIFRRPRFEPEGLEPARDLALQELEGLTDNPQERAILGAKVRHFPPPHNRTDLGDEPGLTAITMPDVHAFWSARVKPLGSILAIAGAVDPDRLVARLNTLLRGWTGFAADLAPQGTPSRGIEHITDDSNQVQIVVMNDAPAEHHKDATLERVAVSVLSGGMSGRLFSEVREKRALCYSVSAGYGAGKLYGSVLSYVGTTPERAQESLDVLLAETRRLSTPEGRVTQEEFDRAIIGLKSRLVFSGESTAGRAHALAIDHHRLGRARSLDELAGEFDRVNLDALNAYVARRNLGTLTIQTLGPTPLTAPSM